MTQADTRGFDYALEPARRRAQHRVDAAIGELGRSQQALQRARDEARRLGERCQDLAQRSTPRQQTLIDPWRAMAAAREWQLWRSRLAEAEQEVKTIDGLVSNVRRGLERARIEQESFEAHHEQALREHQQAVARRTQTTTDQEWLAQRHIHPQEESPK
jgi:hypothetical protein